MRKIITTIAASIAAIAALGSLLLGIVNYLNQEKSIKENQKIAQRNSEISNAVLALQVDQRSQEYVQKIYDELYNGKIEVSNAINKVRSNIVTTDVKSLAFIIDEFEGVGAGFCQGTIESRHIKAVLLRTIVDVCNNDQLFEKYGGKKNGVAILCYEYSQDSKFAKSIYMQNISTCDFIDSQKFTNNQQKDAKWIINPDN